MRCPFCGHDDTQVKDPVPPRITRRSDDGATARLAVRWTTFERVHLRELTVVKKNGERAPFDRDKLFRSLRIALRKRPVDDDRIRSASSTAFKGGWRLWVKRRSRPRSSARWRWSSSRNSIR